MTGSERESMMARILITDDDRDTCTFIESLLAGAGREIVSASTPDEAIARIRREPFDLPISDINLNAALTGLDLLRAFKAEHAAGQVVLTSGFGSLETAIEAMRAGAFDYISSTPGSWRRPTSTSNGPLRRGAFAKICTTG